jgi:hypothetical protein
VVRSKRGSEVNSGARWRINDNIYQNLFLPHIEVWVERHYLDTLKAVRQVRIKANAPQTCAALCDDIEPIDRDGCVPSHMQIGQGPTVLSDALQSRVRHATSAGDVEQR